MQISHTDGILLIDKPTGITSHDVVDIVRRQTGIKCVGHAGTLDPLATGLLIVLVGKEATKRQTEFLKQDKEYQCTLQLGVTTDTYDCEGKVATEADWTTVAKINQTQIKKVLKSFLGNIDQRVPAYSAVKQHGKKLYDLARQGKIKSNDLPIRQVKIISIKLLDFVKDEQQKKYTCTLKVACSSGTYIRSLVHDIGQALGVGATVVALRRTRIGQQHIKHALSLNYHDGLYLVASLANG